MNRTVLQVVSGAVCLGALISISHLPSTSLWDANKASAQAPTNSLEVMTVERLEAILQGETTDLQGNEGQWQFTLDGQQVIVLADATSDRMRIITPVADATTLSVEQVEAMLVANFHSALDARYAVTDGTVVSIFVHPLASLQDADLRSGLQQVITLASTFGTSYSSGGLGFLPNGEPREAVSPQEGELQI